MFLSPRESFGLLVALDLLGRQLRRTHKQLNLLTLGYLSCLQLINTSQVQRGLFKGDAERERESQVNYTSDIQQRNAFQQDLPSRSHRGIDSLAIDCCLQSRPNTANIDKLCFLRVKLETRNRMQQDETR